MTVKAERTRAAILESALSLFRERGFEATTMRDVARRAGVSAGNAYYYFAGKDHLVQGFYAESHADHLAVCEDALAGTVDLEHRLLAVFRTKLETSEPYHRFAGQLFKVAADPQSPLHPFSEASRPVREESIALMARALDGAKLKVPADLRAELPYLLWLHLMGIVLFWIHDDSPGRARSHRMAERTAGIVSKLIGLASNPLLRPLRRSVLELLAEIKSDVEPTPAEDVAQ
ncbi:MAG TPA: TetR family transcriptional regulator [Planctomycetota bacterium]|nr:TetR family transcriptional regulator [Planctomycetota bacterium]